VLVTQSAASAKPTNENAMMVKAKTSPKRSKTRSKPSRTAARSVRWISTDAALTAKARAAIEAIDGWRFVADETRAALETRPPTSGDVLILDANASDANVYETCRALIGRTGCRTFVLTDADAKVAEGIAHFCGATGVLPRKLNVASLRRALGVAEPRAALPAATRSKAARKPVFPKSRLRDMSGSIDTHLVNAITDPETNLFNYAFLNYKLDEEFKRAQRFGQPLACVLVGSDGECSTQTLRELAGIFLSASRDTDVLGRFDQTSFLFFLPSTGPDGARIMAERVVEQAQRQKLCDLLGDPLGLAVGIASTPHAKIQRREDLFAAVRRAFVAAQRKGGGVVLGT